VASGLGLVVAELVTNSFKYAYAAGEKGNVTVDFKRTANGWRLEISDHGRGLPEGFDVDRSKGFGMKIVKTFVRKLNAKLAVSSSPGRTAFEIFGA
jgi:two-component sensor histidine kinase